MNAQPTDSLVLALHYQNQNCHPEGRIKVGVAEDALAWRSAMLAAALRLLDGARGYGVPIIHARLAVRPDDRDVIRNGPLFRQWVELNAWQEGTWGVAFYEGLGPAGDELVVTHIRNNPFFGSPLETLIAMHRPRRLICAGVSTAYAVGFHGAPRQRSGLRGRGRRRCLLDREERAPRERPECDGADRDHQSGRRDRAEFRAGALRPSLNRGDRWSP